MKKLFLLLAVVSISSQFIWSGSAEAQWRPLTRPSGGTVVALEFGPNDRGYLTSASQGILTSKDGGLQWQRDTSLGYGSTATVSSKGEIVFSVFGDYSTDAGTTWHRTTFTSSIVAFAPWGELYVAKYTGGGVFKSPDFQILTSIGIDTIGDVAGIRFSPSGRIYVFTSRGLVVSSHKDSLIWSVDSTFSGKAIRSLLYHDEALYASIDNSGLYKFEEATGWQLRVSDYKVINDIQLFNGRLYLATDTLGLVVSKNYGSTFTRIGEGQLDDHLSLVRRDSAGNLFVASKEPGFGVMRSEDQGETWKRSNIGINHKAYDALALLPDGRLVQQYYRGVQISDPEVAIWDRKVFAGNGREAEPGVVAIDSLGNIYDYNPYPFGFYRSSDFGVTWDTLPSPFSSFLFPGRMAKLTVLPSGDLAAVTHSPNGYSYVSTNKGETWDTVTVTHLKKSNYKFRDILLPCGELLYAALHDTLLLRSSTGGKSWDASLDNGTNKALTSLACDPSSFLLFAASPVGLFRSFTNGDNWTRLAFEGRNVKEVFISGKGHIYAYLADSGMYKSVNGGIEFMKVTEGLPREPVIGIYETRQGKLILQTSGGGYYEESGKSIVNQVHSASSISIALFPNPARSMLSLEVSTEFEGSLKYAIITTEGKTVMTGVLGREAGSPFRVNLDDIPSGVYFVELSGVAGYAIAPFSVLK